MEKCIYDILEEKGIKYKSFISDLIYEFDVIESYSKEIMKCVNNTDPTTIYLIKNILFKDDDIIKYIQHFKDMLISANNTCSKTFYVDNVNVSLGQIESIKMNLQELYSIFSINDPIVDSCDKIHRILTITLCHKELYSNKKFIIIKDSTYRYESIIRRIPHIQEKLTKLEF